MALEGTVAFTGRLASMRRADAFALVRAHGGKPREGVTKRTDVLIVGEFGWPLLDDGRPSNSLARAKSYRVLIVSERQGAVAGVVGIDFSAISRVTRLPHHAARSMI